MKILTIVYDLSLGGTQRAAQNFSIAYHKHGHEVAVFGFLGGGPRQQILHDEGIQVFLPSPNLEGALGQIEHWNPDLIHLHRAGNQSDIIDEILVALKNGKRKCIETNVFSWFDHGNHAHLIDLHLHLSRWCLWRWGIDAEEKVIPPLGTIFPYMVDRHDFFKASEEEILEMRRAWKLPRDALVMGRIGQKSMGKWSALTIEAFEKLALEFPKLYLVVIGLPEGLRPLIEKLSCDIKKRVIDADYLNSDAELRAAYSAFDIFAHTSSIGESFGMVLAESLLCETPIVTRATPMQDNSQGEVVGHEKCGFVAANDDVFIHQLRELLSNGNMRKQLGSQGPKHITERYDLESMTPVLLEIVEILMNSNNQEELREALSKKQYLLKQGTAEALGLMKSSQGEYSLKERLYVRFPHFYRWLQKLKYK